MEQVLLLLSIYFSSDIFIQHDVQELNRVLCDKLEEKMKGSEQECNDL